VVAIADTLDTIFARAARDGRPPEEIADALAGERLRVAEPA